MTEQARLIKIENDREITKETDSQFLFAYQRAVLLTLKDKGILEEEQYQVFRTYPVCSVRRTNLQYKPGGERRHDQSSVLLPCVY